VALCYVLLFLSRLGSLNALEQREPDARWLKWLGGKRPSADVMGDVAQTLDVEALRAILSRQHAKGKRNKGFAPGASGLRFLVLDGHEGVASYRRSWKGCLERIVHFVKDDRTQNYFRYVGAYLTNGQQRLLLDAERQLPGEGEIACALRLMTRLFERHSRAFDVVCGDNLYMDPTLWKLIRAHNKHLIAVLKNEDRDLLKDARSLFAGMAPVRFDGKHTRRACWDLAGFTTWPQSVAHTTLCTFSLPCETETSATCAVKLPMLLTRNCWVLVAPTVNIAEGEVVPMPMLPEELFTNKEFVFTEKFPPVILAPA